MSKLASARGSRWFASWPLVGALALLFVACDLNPQPEVPGSSSSGTGGGAAASGGGTTGSGGTGGGIQMGGSGGLGADAGTGKCAAGCGSGELCNSGECVDDPCAPNSCAAEKACKPNSDFTQANCLPSCADVTCSAGQTCVDGACVATGCAATCAANVAEVRRRRRLRLRAGSVPRRCGRGPVRHRRDVRTCRRRVRAGRAAV
ncbi:MAG: hypothetical protein U0263_31115 [Polyangiaceae bacterium]